MFKSMKNTRYQNNTLEAIQHLEDLTKWNFATKVIKRLFSFVVSKILYLQKLPQFTSDLEE